MSFTAIEIKSAQTYHTDFEKGLRKIDGMINGTVAQKAIIYAGDFENSAGDIKLLNYKNLGDLFA